MDSVGRLRRESLSDSSPLLPVHRRSRADNTRTTLLGARKGTFHLIDHHARRNDARRSLLELTAAQLQESTSCDCHLSRRQQLGDTRQSATAHRHGVTVRTRRSIRTPVPHLSKRIRRVESHGVSAKVIGVTSKMLPASPWNAPRIELIDQIQGGLQLISQYKVP